jgi:hypothetical protein
VLFFQALRLCGKDGFCVTESGFGADMGMEKFVAIKVSFFFSYIFEFEFEFFEFEVLKFDLIFLIFLCV